MTDFAEIATILKDDDEWRHDFRIDAEDLLEAIDLACRYQANMESISRLTAALELIAGHKGKTIYSHDPEYRQGAHDAYEQLADIAADALATPSPSDADRGWWLMTIPEMRSGCALPATATADNPPAVTGRRDGQPHYPEPGSMRDRCSLCGGWISMGHARGSACRASDADQRGPG